MATEIPKNDNVKSWQRKERRKVQGTQQNPEENSKIVFSEEVVRLENNSSLLRINHTDESGKIILVIAGEVSEYSLTSRRPFFLDCTFKYCSRQFAQLYSLYVGIGNPSHGKYISLTECNSGTNQKLYVWEMSKRKCTYKYVLILIF